MEKDRKISFKNVSKKYGDFIALNNISFDIPKNSIVGLIGENGSGKTTLIKCLLGYFNDYTGNINVFGVENTKINQLHKLLSYVPDTSVFYEELTVIEHLEFIGKIYGTEKCIDEYLLNFDLKNQLNKLPHELSKGNKQKLSICCALLREYEILISDEPFSGLDPIQINVLKKQLIDIRKNDKTIIVSTHLLSLIENLCDFYVILNKGNLIGFGSINEIRKNESGYNNLEELYLHLSGYKR